MLSRSWLRTIRSTRTSRRGNTVLEVGVASTILMMVMGGVLAALNTAARMEQGIILQQGTDQDATVAMARMVADVREAKRVVVLSPWMFRVYYPVVRADGNYDRFVVDESYYIQYARTTANGSPSANGSYLWKKTTSTTGASICENVTALIAELQGSNAVRMSLRVQKSGSLRAGDTLLNERVLYLRNY
jgi:hypothetical protein